MNEFAPPALVRPDTAELDQLAFEVNAAHEAGERAARQGLERFKEAGEALAKAKEKVPHGDWIRWLAKHVRFDQRTAQRYMRVAREWGKYDSVSHLADALILLAEDPEAEEDVPITEPILCYRCRRVGAVLGCLECKATREGQRPGPYSRSQKAKREPGDDSAEIARQQAVEAETAPPPARPAWADVLDLHEELLEEVRSFIPTVRPGINESARIEMAANLRESLSEWRRAFLKFAGIKESDIERKA